MPQINFTHGTSTIPIIIGVTGHRDLRPEDVPMLEGRVRGIFEELRKKYPDTPLLLLSPLAEGADRLVARVAMEQPSDNQPRAQLVVPLPLPRSEYEKDFQTQKSKHDFNELFGQAWKCFELPLMAGNTPENIQHDGPHRDAQYAQVGAYLVRHSQILIALWDGVKQEKRKEAVGGTAQIVRFKLEGIPEPYAPPRKPLDVIDTGPVYHILTPRAKNPRPNGEPFSLHIDFPADGGDADSQQRSYERILEHMNTFNRDARRPSPKRAESIKLNKESLIPEAKAVGLPQTACTILEQYAVADTLALHFQRWRRRTLIALFVIAVLAVVSFEVYAHLLPGNPWILFLYLVALGSAILLYLWASDRKYSFKYLRWVSGRDYQNKHLDYRALAEGLRVQLFWHLAGLPDEVAEHYLRQHRTELEWIRNAIRAWSVLAVQLCAESHPASATAAIQNQAQSLKDLVLEHWVEHQRIFFSGATDRDHHKLERHEGIVDWLFSFGLLLAVSVIVLDFILHDSEEYSHWHHWLIVIMGTAPAIAAAMGGYAEKMAFSAQARRYQWMNALFTRASAQLQALLKQNELSKAQDLIRDLGKEALEENGDWVIIHRERTPDFRKG